MKALHVPREITTLSPSLSASLSLSLFALPCPSFIFPSLPFFFFQFFRFFAIRRSDESARGMKMNCVQRSDRSPLPPPFRPESATFPNISVIDISSSTAWSFVFLAGVFWSRGSALEIKRETEREREREGRRYRHFLDTRTSLCDRRRLDQLLSRVLIDSLITLWPCCLPLLCYRLEDRFED